MRNKISISYFDREKHAVMQEKVFAGGFLFWSYNSRLGRLATDLVLSHKAVSLLYGWLNRRPFSRHRIRSFVEEMNVKADEFTCSIDDFDSFNHFFVREIDPRQRPIHSDPDVCIAPVDGKILAYPVIMPDTIFRIKRSTFNLRSFLDDRTLAERFAGGSMIVSRLSLADYHHFHFPDWGVPRKAVPIRGKYYVSGPYALSTLIPFYKENHRALTLFDSDNFGQMAIIEVGAFTVGSIQQRYRPGVRVSRADQKGFFELGGSTVVLLFQEDSIELDPDLCMNTRNNLETYVRLGDSIGRRSSQRSKKARSAA